MNYYIKLKIILIIFCVSFASNIALSKEVRFVHLTDTHVSLITDPQGNIKLAGGATSLKKAIEKINSMKNIDFVLFSGDNIEKSDRMALVAFAKMVDRINKPLYVIFGNHDIKKFGGIGKPEYFKLLNKFSHNKIKSLPAVFEYDKSLTFIFLDGTYSILPGAKGYFNDQELAWLDKTLTKYKNKKVVLISHYPLIEPRPYESHKTINADKVLDLIDKHKNVIAVLSGHYHEENEIRQDGVVHISTGALADGWFKVITIDYEPQKGDYIIKTTIFSTNDD